MQAAAMGDVTRCVTARIAATRCGADLHRNLFGHTTWDANTDLVGNLDTNPLTTLDTFGFRYLATNRVGDFAGSGFAHPFGSANRDLLRLGFAYVTSATAVDRSLLLLAHPACAAVIDHFLFLLADPFSAAVIDGFRARFTNRTAYRVGALDTVLFTAVLGTADFLGFTRWHPNLAADGAARRFATNLVARPRDPSSATGARIVGPTAWNTYTFCVGAAGDRLRACFPVTATNLDSSFHGIRNTTGTSNGSRALFFDLTANVVSHLPLLHFFDRATNRVIHGSLLHLLNGTSNRVIDGFRIVLFDRSAHCVTARLVGRFLDGTLDRVCFVTVTGLADGSADGNLDGFPDFFVTITIPCLFAGIVNDARTRTHDRVATASSVFGDGVCCSGIK